MARARQRVQQERARFSFDAHVPALEGFFRQVMAAAARR
jgi:hypothetical protein